MTNSSIAPQRILHIVSTMGRGGTETLLMNVYRNIDTSQVQFDFVSHGMKQDDYEEEIRTLGGKVYKINSLGKSGPILYLYKLIKLIKQNNYEAVHIHTDFQSGFPALAAKLAGVKTRICHVHSTNWPKGNRTISKVVLKFLKLMMKSFATDYCACSHEAAYFFFSQKMIKNKKILILKNGVEVRNFTECFIADGESVQKELNIPEDTKIIGHIGRFSESKNHLFILRILKKLKEHGENFVLILVGDGPLKTLIENEAKAMGIYDFIRFVGVRSDIPRLMKTFDVFILPSLYEGFGIVTLEAQCTGTPCVVSDSVPKTTDLELGLIKYVSLQDNLEVWCKEIMNAIFVEKPESDIILRNATKLGFNIQQNIGIWLELYGCKRLIERPHI
jgi:glycosyltransferase EpsF